MYRWLLCLILALFLLTPNLSFSDTWEDFQKFNDDFYFLNDLDFNTLSCTVALPEFQDMLNENRNQIQAAGKNLIIKENLAQFRMVFAKTGSISFTKPEIIVEFIETDASKKATLETGIRMIESGFKTTVDGAVMTLQGLFSSYVRPAPPEYKLDTFQREDDNVYMTYEQQGMPTDVVCTGLQCTRTISTSTTDIVSLETYEISGSKMFIQDIHGTMEQAQQKIVSDMSITYQLVRELRIPETISASSTVTYSMGNFNAAFSIKLRNCQVE